MNRKKIIVGAMLALGFMVSARAQNDAVVVDQVVAVVGKNIVKLSDVENSYAQMRMQMGYDNAYNNRCSILESLLLQKLLLHKG